MPVLHPDGAFNGANAESIVPQSPDNSSTVKIADSKFIFRFQEPKTPRISISFNGFVSKEHFRTTFPIFVLLEQMKKRPRRTKNVCKHLFYSNYTPFKKYSGLFLIVPHKELRK